MAEPSQEVVDRAQQGDDEVLTQLVLGQQSYVYSIAMSVLANPEDAADMTQEVFTRLFRVLPSYRGETKFTTWLYRMVVNLCRDELRRRRREVLSFDNDQEKLAANIADDDPWSDPAQALSRAEVMGEVRRAVAKLETRYRLVLTLYYFGDLKYQDIAQVLGLPLNTVKSHLRRGKERLAELLRWAEEPVSAPASAREKGRPAWQGGAACRLPATPRYRGAR